MFQTIFDSGTLQKPGYRRGLDEQVNVAAFAGVVQPRAKQPDLGVLTGNAARGLDDGGNLLGEILMVILVSRVRVA